MEFVEASAIELPYDADEFDFVYCRLVLTHVAHPESAIGEFHRVLRPGGKVACEELIGPQAYSSPPSAVYDRLSAMVSEFGKGRGIDYAVGARLPHLVKAAGFEAPQARFVQPAYFRGEQKRWWEHCVREAGAVLLKSGFISPDDLASLLDELAAVSADETILVAQPPLAQVWATRS